MNIWAELPLWLVVASLTLNALFLRRLLLTIDRLSDCLVGTTDRRGLIDRVRGLEKHVGLADDDDAPWPEAERRHVPERRRRPAP